MRVLNKKYWPYQIRLDTPIIEHRFTVQECERFCYEHFKSGNWHNTGWYFAFKRGTDFSFFMLRWGG